MVRDRFHETVRTVPYITALVGSRDDKKSANHHHKTDLLEIREKRKTIPGLTNHRRQSRLPWLPCSDVRIASARSGKKILFFLLHQPPGFLQDRRKSGLTGQPASTPLRAAPFKIF
jgi:hypothetical protein